jgi:hypothetical protein
MAFKDRPSLKISGSYMGDADIASTSNVCIISILVILNFLNLVSWFEHMYTELYLLVKKWLKLYFKFLISSKKIRTANFDFVRVKRFMCLYTSNNKHSIIMKTVIIWDQRHSKVCVSRPTSLTTFFTYCCNTYTLWSTYRNKLEPIYNNFNLSNS